MEQEAALHPPIERLVSADDAAVFDAIVNACYHPADRELAFDETIEMLKSIGISKTQIDAALRKVHAQGMSAPIPPTVLERIEIRSDKKREACGLIPAFQNVCDKFGLYIYGKMFNAGVNGAFGKGQNILPSARSKMIILHFPEGCKQHVQSYSKLHNSIKHYQKQGRGNVIIEYSNIL